MANENRRRRSDAQSEGLMQAGGAILGGFAGAAVGTAAGAMVDPAGAVVGAVIGTAVGGLAGAALTAERRGTDLNVKVAASEPPDLGDPEGSEERSRIPTIDDRQEEQVPRA